MPINVTRSYLPDLKSYEARVEQVFQSGWLTNQGDCLLELTSKLEAYLGVRNLVLTANATLALQIAYKALGLEGEVITTPFSFVATTSSLVWEGLTPKFADIHPENCCIDETRIEAMVNEKTSAILPVHVYGNVCAVEAIAKIAERHKLKVIYDAAPAFAVSHQGQSVLNFGDISVLSFHATKLFHTVEGGALVIKDDEVYKKIKSMINFGYDGDGSGEIVGLGINAKMSELHAAMGLCILDDVEKIIVARKAICDYYSMRLGGRLQILLPKPTNYAYFPVLFETEAPLLRVLEALGKIEVFPRRYFYPSLNTLPYFSQTAMPISESIAARVLCLPVYPGLMEADLERICTEILEVI